MAPSAITSSFDIHHAISAVHSVADGSNRRAHAKGEGRAVTGAVPQHVPRLVTIGGRSGPSLIVQGFRGSGWAVTAIVITTDSGSSSGIIRDQFGIPAPGDIRSVLAAAAEPHANLKPLADLFEHRFRTVQDPTLRNMA